MALCTSLNELSEFAIDDDLQSITGVWLRGFPTDFSNVLKEIDRYSKEGTDEETKPWVEIGRVLTSAYGGVAYTNAGRLFLPPSFEADQQETARAPDGEDGSENDTQIALTNAVSTLVTVLQNARPTDNSLQRVTQLLSIDLRDYNYVNKLLGFGAKDEELSTIVEDAGGCPGLDNEAVKFWLGKDHFIQRYCDLINTARGRTDEKGNILQGRRVAKPTNDAGRPIDEVPAGGDKTITDAIVTDDGDSRLYLKLDLSEWIYINNPDILHVVIESPQSLNGYYPLGRTTVWLPANAQVQHVRSKTAKTFLRGQIAQRLRMEDLESNLAGFVNTIFDTDSEQAYSSMVGPC